MSRGDHIYVQRPLYRHHGIDLGDGMVVDFAASDGTKAGAAIQQRSLEAFANGLPVEYVRYGTRLDPEETVKRALAAIGATGYNLVGNNCEHFASWCVTGVPVSAQVEGVASSISFAVFFNGAPMLGLSLIALSGGAAAMSGPNLMSGLKNIGGSPMGGLRLAGGASGAAAALLVANTLRDSESLPDDECFSRRVARYGAAGGALVGLAIALHLVRRMGHPGVSAAGLSSGLAAVGGVTGGGMRRGIETVIVGPALVTFLTGATAYNITQMLTAPEQPTTPTS